MRACYFFVKYYFCRRKWHKSSTPNLFRVVSLDRLLRIIHGKRNNLKEILKKQKKRDLNFSFCNFIDVTSPVVNSIKKKKKFQASFSNIIYILKKKKLINKIDGNRCTLFVLVSLIPWLCDRSSRTHRVPPALKKVLNEIEPSKFIPNSKVYYINDRKTWKR